MTFLFEIQLKFGDKPEILQNIVYFITWFVF